MPEPRRRHQPNQGTHRRGRRSLEDLAHRDLRRGPHHPAMSLTPTARGMSNPRSEREDARHTSLPIDLRAPEPRSPDRAAQVARSARCGQGHDRGFAAVRKAPAARSSTTNASHRPLHRQSGTRRGARCRPRGAVLLRVSRFRPYVNEGTRNGRSRWAPPARRTSAWSNVAGPATMACTSVSTLRPGRANPRGRSGPRWRSPAA